MNILSVYYVKVFTSINMYCFNMDTNAGSFINGALSTPCNNGDIDDGYHFSFDCSYLIETITI